ncbi:DinB family protein [Bernardetia litoralis DSM 6794]|uniref:DinB family protein n=1 Tax=Bernardetia litoralis (strain ATCC 23117 / DSM 6794 / NBRC 15988 / NCIMB 1366 / Fx l1 / Sio-4) TaxID=880071 RepID=I4ALZ1_BERLS|nr:DinB family protein [Bernardetia litoralis]AFM04976.1 DinB family protein [Bernardetia litoralis DSM 6794]
MNHSNIAVLKQLNDLLNQLSDTEYAAPLSLISQNTIGKHVRHILEFYTCLLTGIENKSVDYDARKRNLDLENYTQKALETSNIIAQELLTLNKEIELELLATLPHARTKLSSTAERELLYVLEHTIHHFAIIKIAVKNEFPHIRMTDGFGVAYATLQHQEEIIKNC